MKHFIDEEYETNITNHYENNDYYDKPIIHYENNDYYDKPIIHYEPYPDDWYEGTIKHFQD